MPAHPPAQACACYNSNQSAGTPGARRCRRRYRGRLAIPGGKGRKTPVLRKTGVLYNRVRSCLAPATAEPLPGYKTVGFAQAPAQFKAPAGYTRARVRRPPTPHPTALRSGGRKPLERSAISTLEPFGVPGLIYAAHNRTNRSGYAGVDFFAWAVYDRIQQPPAPFGVGILHAAAEALLQMTAATDHLALFSRSAARCHDEPGNPGAMRSFQRSPLCGQSRQPQRRANHRRALPGLPLRGKQTQPLDTYRNNSNLLLHQGAAERHGSKQKARHARAFFA